MPARFQVVRESARGDLSYPDVLPKERGMLATKFELFLAALCFQGAISLVYWNQEEPTDYVEPFKLCGGVLCKCISLVGAFSFLTRMGPFLEDYCNHLASRHGGSVSTLVIRAFKFPTRAWIVILPAFLVTWQVFNSTPLCATGAWPPLLLLLAASLLARSLDMFGSPLGLSLSLSGMDGLDYGSGMAESFYYGYLNMVLPATGDANKGVIERIEDYIASGRLDNDKFPVKKLFVLIPSSTYISCSLVDLADGWMEAATSLEEQRFNVAGVVNRSYKNQVYKIRDPNDPDISNVVYVVAEGATPLKTLHDVSKSHSHYREHFSELTHQFFTTLRRKIRTNEKTRNTCELIYYFDKNDFGESINVGKLILERIHEIQARQQLRAQ